MTMGNRTAVQEAHRQSQPATIFLLMDTVDRFYAGDRKRDRSLDLMIEAARKGYPCWLCQQPLNLSDGPGGLYYPGHGINDQAPLCPDCVKRNLTRLELLARCEGIQPSETQWSPPLVALRIAAQFSNVERITQWQEAAGGMDVPLDTTPRQCGDCTKCCTVMAVNEIGKPEHQSCQHQCAQGCAIYQTRPKACRDWSCLWLHGATIGLRPDLSHMVVNMSDDTHIEYQSYDGREIRLQAVTVLCDEKYPGAHADPVFRDWLDEARCPAVVYIGPVRSFGLLPPSIMTRPFWAKSLATGQVEWLPSTTNLRLQEELIANRATPA